jgi:4'-phosphopantetheinyl transferase
MNISGQDNLHDETVEAALCARWSLPPAQIILSEDEVHVWRAWLNLKSSHRITVKQTLSADELARANRFHSPRDRERFVASRGILRQILGRYLNLDPAELHFSYGLKGKPELSGTGCSQKLHFNVSHSNGLSLIALAWEKEVGVDVEFIREGVAEERIAEHFFSPIEMSFLRALSQKDQTPAFFACWARKEACLKARGEGLQGGGLDEFTVSLVPARHGSRTGVEGDNRHTLNLSLWDLVPANGFVGALAVEKKQSHLSCWDFVP